MSKKVEVNYYVPEPEDNRSMMEVLADLKASDPDTYDSVINNLIADKGEEWFANIKYDWSVNGRPKQFLPEPRSAWTVLVWLAGRSFGKMQPLDTQLLTANRSWVTLSELRVGDYLFDERGNPTKVLELHPIQTPKK